METKRNLLNHFKQLQHALSKVEGAEAFLNVTSFVAEVRFGNRVHQLLPMFVENFDQRTVYTPRFSPGAIRFAGWRPYASRPVPEIGKKLQFKTFLKTHGLRHPAYEASLSHGIDCFLIKRDISSFGADIRGPFRSTAGIEIDAGKGDYCEQFVLGEIAKIWFHNTEPVCMELKPMPAVIGDGASTIRNLATSQIFRKKIPVNWSPVEQLVALNGYNLDSVLPEGDQQIIDYRYTSPFLKPKDTREVFRLTEEKGCDDLRKLGGAVWECLPEVWRTTALYSIDAIRDHEGQLWFLEANFTPFLHPAVYLAMLAGLQSSENFRELRFAPLATATENV
jgi:hypothetical protein